MDLRTKQPPFSTNYIIFGIMEREVNEISVVIRSITAVLSCVAAWTRSRTDIEGY